MTEKTPLKEASVQVYYVEDESETGSWTCILCDKDNALKIEKCVVCGTARSSCEETQSHRDTPFSCSFWCAIFLLLILTALGIGSGVAAYFMAKQPEYTLYLLIGWSAYGFIPLVMFWGYAQYSKLILKMACTVRGLEGDSIDKDQKQMMRSLRLTGYGACGGLGVVSAGIYPWLVVEGHPWLALEISSFILGPTLLISIVTILAMARFSVEAIYIFLRDKKRRYKPSTDKIPHQKISTLKAPLKRANV